MPIDMTKRKTYIGDVFAALLDRGWAIQETVDFCDRLSTVDAVPVVRCRDCTHGELCLNLQGAEYVVCKLDEHHVWLPGGFCSYGERRADDA